MTLLPLEPIVYAALRRLRRFFRNWSLSSVLEAASWRSNTVFTSFYIKDVQYILDNVHSLGPFVAAGARLA